MTGVQDWFEGIFSSVSRWITDSVSGLWNSIASSFSNVSRWITDSVAGLWSSVSKAFEGVGKWITDSAASLWTNLSKAFDAVKTRITDGFGAAWTTISAAFDSVKTWVSNGFSAAWKSISTAFDAVKTWVSGAVTSLTDSVCAFFTDLWAKTSMAVSGAVKWLGDSITLAVGTIAGYVQDALKGVAEAVGGALKGALEWLWGSIQFIAGQVAGAAVAVKDAVSGVLTPALIGIVERATGAISLGSPEKEVEEAFQKFSKQLLETTQKLLPEKHESLPDLATLLTATVGVVGANLGMIFTATSVSTYLDLAHPAKMTGIMTVAEQLCYGINTPATVGPLISSFVWYGITAPLRYRLAAQFPYVIPDPMDLIRFVVREVIDVKVFYENMLFHGYDRFWGEAYWEAHFVLPGLSTLVDAHHRGVVSSEELDKYVFWHDYKPTPRPGIGKTDIEIVRSTYKTLIPRVDLRYAWEMGRLSTEELTDWYRVLGYEEDAELMADIQIDRAMVEEVTKVRGEWLTDFIDGYIDEAILRANLEEIGIGAIRVDYYVAYALKRRERANRKDLLANYRAGYLKDLVTDADLEVRVGEILVDREASENFLESAYVAKYMKPKVTKAA